MKIPCENLSKRQRRGTPVAFALYLLAGVRQRYQTERVAVLFTQPRSTYGKLWPWVDCWGERRDATKYDGPWPVICHPPCGPWGQYARVSHETINGGIIAMEMVHRWGGVVEQPSGSQLFRYCGLHGDIERVNQGDYGHLALKPTLLYWV